MDFAGNYRFLGIINPAPLRTLVQGITEDEWTCESPKGVPLSPMAKNVHMLKIYGRAGVGREHVYQRFANVLQPIFDVISKAYDHTGYAQRALVARIQPGFQLKPHIDDYRSRNPHDTFNFNDHRIHVPVITAPGVTFLVSNEKKYMGVGEIWEINNMHMHTCRNDSSIPRVHLLVDWYT